ncbi:MAG: L-rhamnose mutarotase [Sphingomonas bacterium]|uniref:L-rhamnose mutarotase n=1 Tax=Sphingomonas bacterium TaxID=1895847 RepID=UPI00262F9045|nr:L-rhamnose mutarotase [Sphingomonas bacterium]MDB5704024.1 L-rhamnose mutarotase [Sphingomonas bacterium]
MTTEPDGSARPTRHVLLIDLVDEPEAIARYEAWHAAERLPPEIGDSIRRADISAMEIYRTGNRLVMVMETAAGFDPARKAAADAADPAVRAWESRMCQVQRPLPWARDGAKWTAAARIFSLGEQP